jgi:hypothetical protein
MAHWDMEDHDQMMIITMIFSWYVIKAKSAIRHYCYHESWLKLNFDNTIRHCAIVAVIMFFVVFVVGKIVKRGSTADDFGRTDIHYQKVAMNGLKGGQSTRPIISNGSTLRQAFDETSEDEV